MFERFTDPARQVVVAAQAEARELRHDHIGTEHELLGLLSDSGEVAAEVLASFGITADRVRQAVVRLAGTGKESVSGQIPFTTSAKLVLERSLRSASDLGYTYVTPGHVLLALLHESEGLATQVLLGAGADLDALRAATADKLPELRPEPVRRAAEVAAPAASVGGSIPPLIQNPPSPVHKVIDPRLAERFAVIRDGRRSPGAKLTASEVEATKNLCSAPAGERYGLVQAQTVKVSVGASLDVLVVPGQSGVFLLMPGDRGGFVGFGATINTVLRGEPIGSLGATLYGMAPDATIDQPVTLGHGSTVQARVVKNMYTIEDPSRSRDRAG